MRLPVVRSALLFALFVALAAAFVLFLPRTSRDDLRLAWLATAHQFGPVGKTQPAWSPGGTRLAFTVGNYDAQFFGLRR
jgi:hypothetical protein